MSFGQSHGLKAVNLNEVAKGLFDVGLRASRWPGPSPKSQQKERANIPERLGGHPVALSSEWFDHVVAASDRASLAAPVRDAPRPRLGPSIKKVRGSNLLSSTSTRDAARSSSCHAIQADERAALRRAFGSVGAPALATHIHTFVPLLRLLECASGCNRATKSEAVVTFCVVSSVGGRIESFRRSDRISAQVCKRRRGTANDRTGLLACQGLAPEGCWFESNRGAKRRPLTRRFPSWQRRFSVTRRGRG
jgi:hypothetical protein